MTRISTAGNYTSMLSNLSRAQLEQAKWGDQISTKQVATDLKGFAKNAEYITALKNVQSKVGSFLEQNTLLTDKLGMQDVALSRAADTAQNIRTAVTEAVAAGKADTLMEQLSSYFADAVSALNTQHQGQFLFAGGKIDTQPITATTLDELVPPLPATPAELSDHIAGLFSNDQFSAQIRLNETATINPSFHADALGSPLFTVLQTITAYVQENGEFDGNLTQDQTDFLKSQLTELDKARKGLIDETARNGMLQNRVDQAAGILKERESSMEVMIGGVVDADYAAASVRLNIAQLSLEGSARVFSMLSGSSILNVL